MNEFSSCAIVVTYNKKSDLVICIQSLLSQTESIDEILIVDNASTDGTLDHLVESEIFPCRSKSTPLTHKISKTNLVYFNTGGNIGGAGGFSFGQKKAVERGHYYIWMMDDDAVPTSSCFRILKKVLDEKIVDLVNPLVVNVNSHEMLSFGLSQDVKSVSDAMAQKDHKGMIYGKANPFNGTLLTKNIVENVGFVKAEMFIWGDEVEYINRVVSKGYSCGTNVDSVIYHPASKTTYDSCLFGLISMVSKPRQLEMNYYRNLGYLSRQNRAGFRKLNFFIKGFLYFLIKLEFRRLIRFSMYFFDGFFDLYRLPPLIKD